MGGGLRFTRADPSHAWAVTTQTGAAWFNGEQSRGVARGAACGGDRVRVRVCRGGLWH